MAVRVRQNQTEPSERRNALREKLQNSDKCPTDERQQLEELLLELNEAFALDDNKLGETHTILIQGKLDQCRLHHDDYPTPCVRN